MLLIVEHEHIQLDKIQKDWNSVPALNKGAKIVGFCVLKFLLLFISLSMLRITITFISSIHFSLLVQIIFSTAADSPSSPCIPIMASIHSVSQQYLLSIYYVPVLCTGVMLSKSRK